MGNNEHGKFSKMGNRNIMTGDFNASDIKKYAKLECGSEKFQVDSVEKAVELLIGDFNFKDGRGILYTDQNLICLTFCGSLPDDYKSIEFYKENHLESKKDIKKLLYSIFGPFIKEDSPFNIVSVCSTFEDVVISLAFDLGPSKEDFWNVHDGLLNSGFKFNVGGGMFFSEKD